MSDLSLLPQINFAEKSTQDIESSVITTYEALSGRTLAPGDPVRIFLEAVAAIITQQRVLIDFGAKQNLLAYSGGDYLDHIGALVGTERLSAKPAMTTVRFTLSSPQPSVVTIPIGIRVTSGNNVYFATSAATSIPAGQLTTDVDVVCTAAGTIGNGYYPGQINKLVDPLQWVQSATNTTISEGGSDIESDDGYRERIRQAPESFSVAGPDGAYIYWAKSTSQQIIDVAVYSPNPGEVEIRPLLVDGELPGQELIQAVYETCNDRMIRPLTDRVTVLAPESVSYTVILTYYINRNNSTTSLAIQEAVSKAVSDYVIWQKSKIGRDVNPSELVWRVRAAGASRVAVALPLHTVLDIHQVAIAGTVTATFGGLEDG